jgi:hypothetical protein
MAWRMQLGADIGPVSVTGNPMRRQCSWSLRCQQLKASLEKGAPRRARSLPRWPISDYNLLTGVEQQRRTHIFSRIIVQQMCVADGLMNRNSSDLRSILATDRSTVVCSSSTKGSCESTCPETTLILQILCSLLVNKTASKPSAISSLTRIA